MELLDRYLQAVKKFLPSRRQDDIIAELRANMESQLEDKEAELARPLTATEAGDWLKQMGAPMMVAARYQPQQYLIGPAIFPIYLYVLRRVIVLALIVYSAVVAVVIPLTAPSGTALIASALRIPGILLTTAVWVTAVFAAVEFFATHHPGKCPPIDALFGAWSPSTLPPLEKMPTTGRKPRSFAQAVADIVFGLFFLGWLLLIPRHLFLIMGPGAFYWYASPFQFANVWMTFFWWAVALSVAQLVWRCVDLVRGTWQQSARATHDDASHPPRSAGASTLRPRPSLRHPEASGRGSTPIWEHALHNQQEHSHKCAVHLRNHRSPARL